MVQTLSYLELCAGEDWVFGIQHKIIFGKCSVGTSSSQSPKEGGWKSSLFKAELSVLFFISGGRGASCFCGAPPL